LKLGTDVIWVSSQWFIGDDANQNPKLADYWVANLHGSYQLTKEWQIYGVINNLFNRKFATVGTFFDTQSTVAIAIPNVLNDPRMVTPAQPLSVYVGMRAKLLGHNRQAGARVRNWHETAVLCVPTNVCSWWKSGRAADITAMTPSRHDTRRNPAVQRSACPSPAC